MGDEEMQVAMPPEYYADGTYCTPVLLTFEMDGHAFHYYALHSSETQQTVASNAVLHDAECKMYAVLQTTLVQKAAQKGSIIVRRLSADEMTPYDDGTLTECVRNTAK